MDPDPNPDPVPDPVYLLKFTEIFKQSKIVEFILIFRYFYAKTFHKLGNFYILSFFDSSDLGFEITIIFFFFAVLVDILPLGSGSVDPHIFADPDPVPGSQNLADPTDPDPDPDPKHCSKSRGLAESILNTVLRVQLILMQIQIWSIDPFPNSRYGSRYMLLLKNLMKFSAKQMLNSSSKFSLAYFYTKNCLNNQRIEILYSLFFSAVQI